MDRGIDTTFLVQVEIAEHPSHREAVAKRDELLDAGDRFVLTAQVLAEFVHVVTDRRRFAQPLDMARAVARAEDWWNAEEVAHAFPTPASTRQMLDWMRENSLGQERILDTQLAATLYCHGVTSIVSSNARDYSVFGCFDIIVP